MQSLLTTTSQLDQLSQISGRVEQCGTLIEQAGLASIAAGDQLVDPALAEFQQVLVDMKNQSTYFAGLIKDIQEGNVEFNDKSSHALDLIHEFCAIVEKSLNGAMAAA